jgi:hypothetical protein
MRRNLQVHATFKAGALPSGEKLTGVQKNKKPQQHDGR